MSGAECPKTPPRGFGGVEGLAGSGERHRGHAGRHGGGREGWAVAPGAAVPVGR